MNGHKLNAIKRTSRKDALLAQLIFMMGKFNIDYAMLARLTGQDKRSIKYGVQHPDHIKTERLVVLINAILDYIEMVKCTDFDY